jgi:hypothetical protein
MFSLQFVLVELWFDVRMRSQEDTEQFVISGHHYAFGAEQGVLQEDARPWVLLPVEG